MTLAMLIRKRDSGKVATAIPATSATGQAEMRGSVARVATIAVARPSTVKNEASVIGTADLPVSQKERAELTGLITAVAAFYGFAPEETLEAREIAAGDVRVALSSFRAIAKRYGLSASPDDRVMCRDCGNLILGHCEAAAKGLMPDTYRGYSPVQDSLRHCPHFSRRPKYAN